MKIGIITWFRHENYGTVLQAIALQKYLRKNGYSVELVDFHIQDEIQLKKKNNSNFIQKNYYYLSRIIFHLWKRTHKKELQEKSCNFQKIIQDHCIITKEIKKEEEYIELCNKYDCLIFGSDQIWNPNWYHPFYFANYDAIHTDLIAYAASFGVSSIPSKLKPVYQKALSRFKSIGLREEKGCELVSQISDKKPQMVVDPTMLLSSSEWEQLEHARLMKEKYIVCYFLSDNFSHWRAAKKFAKKKHLPLVIIPQGGFSYISSKYVITNCGIEDFLSLIHNAEYVITDSFHGTVFSIIYQKPFYTFERHSPTSPFSQNSRIDNLLKLAGASKYLIKYNSSTIHELDIIDYHTVSKNIEKHIKRSKEYLRDSLK